MADPREFDVVVVGAGPAGIAAACTAVETGARVALIDENPESGGQIWRRDVAAPPYRAALPWLGRLERSAVKRISGARVVAASAPSRTLALEQAGSSAEIVWRKLILATGARERFLPFPGWTLPGVVGAGGLQALVKSGLDVRGVPVVVAGTGPLLLAVAAYLRRSGARVLTIVEQAPLRRLIRFAAQSVRYSKAGQALGLGLELLGILSRAGSWVELAEGSDRLTAVRVRTAGGVQTFPCEYLAIGFGLVPNLELAALLGCELEGGFVHVSADQSTSVPGVFAAGEITGIAGVDAALLEGQIAGSGRTLDLRRWNDFKRLLEETFALRDELRNLAGPDTIVCRCEDVRSGALQDMTSWREAKLHTRCGMGPCQGRMCGPAVEFLKGWHSESVRPPVLPARVETLASQGMGPR